VKNMKILVAVDMEGVSGVVHWDQTDPGHAEYARFRKLMTADVNAAVRGAYDGGATEVIVSDGHDKARNLLIEELDGRVRLNCGRPSPLGMVTGVERDVRGAMFVGYHARVGTPNAILDHTWSSSCIANLRLQGREVGEIGLNGAVCGHFGVPVVLVSGDQAACAEALDLFGPVETAVVKKASGRMAAECLPPEAAQQAIYEAALRATRRLSAGQAPKALQFEQPLVLAIDWVTSDMADRAGLLPNASRRDGRRVEYVADDILVAYRTLFTAVEIARG
jgi:D-amino peptidase